MTSKSPKVSAATRVLNVSWLGQKLDIFYEILALNSIFKED